MGEPPLWCLLGCPREPAFHGDMQRIHIHVFPVGGTTALEKRRKTAPAMNFSMVPVAREATPRAPEGRE